MLTGPAYTIASPRGPILDPGQLDPSIVATSAVIAHELRIRLRASGGFAPVWLVFGPPSCDCPVCQEIGGESIYSMDDRFEPLTEERQ